MSILSDPGPSEGEVANDAPLASGDSATDASNGAPTETQSSSEPSNAPSASVPSSASPTSTTIATPVKSQYDQITDALMNAIGDVVQHANFKCLFYGPPGSTKSSMLGEIPNNLIVDLEKGLVAAKTAHVHTGRPMANNVKAYPYKTFDGTQMLVDRMQDGLFNEFEVLSIDTISTMHKKELEAITRRGHEVRPSKNLYVPETADYTEVNEKLSRFVRGLQELPRDIVILGHSQTVEPSNKPPKTYLDFSEKLTNKLMAMMDIVGYIEMREYVLEGGEKKQYPTMRVISDGSIYAKSRVPLPAEIINPRWVDLKAEWQKAMDTGTLAEIEEISA